MEKLFSYIISFIIFLTIVTTFAVSVSFTKPLKKLADSAKRISEGNLSESIIINSNGEVGALSQSLNKMVDSLKGATEKYKILSSNLEKEVDIKTRRLADQNKFLQDSNRAMINLSEDLEVEKNKATKKGAEDEAILASIGEGLVVVNENNKINFLNSTGEGILKYKFGEVVGKTWSDVVSFRDNKGNIFPRENEPLEVVKKTGEIFSAEISNSKYFLKTTRIKNSIPIAFTATPVFLDKKISGIVFVFRDITKEAEINRAKTEFVSLASHQLRTPVSAIKWYSEMLLGEDAGKLNEKQRRYIGEVYRGNERMVTLINDLLDISRMEMGKLIPKIGSVDIRKIINEIIKEHKAVITNRKLKVLVDIDKSIKEIETDPTLIRVSLQNIISNAIGYSSAGGMISCKVFAKDSIVLFEVRDGGIGIPKDKQEKIFEKLFRAENAVKFKPEGTGLGLYLTKSIIEILGGRIWFESEEGRGTTFWFDLPISGDIKKKRLVSQKGG